MSNYFKVPGDLNKESNNNSFFYTPNDLDSSANKTVSSAEEINKFIVSFHKTYKELLLKE